MDRVTTSNANEIIDLTGDSPVVNSMRSRNSRARSNNLPQNSRGSIARHFRTLNDSVISFPPHQHHADISEGLDDSHIQIIDPEEAQFMVPRFLEGDEFRVIDNSKSINEYSSPVPCIYDSYTGQPEILSCPICFEPLVKEHKPMATHCGHVFCAMCLKKTLQGSRNKACPKCNIPVKIKSCIRLFF